MSILLFLSLLSAVVGVVAEDKILYISWIEMGVNSDTLTVDFRSLGGYLNDDTHVQFDKVQFDQVQFDEVSSESLDPLYRDAVLAPNFGRWVRYDHFYFYFNFLSLGKKVIIFRLYLASFMPYNKTSLHINYNSILAIFPLSLNKF